MTKVRIIGGGLTGILAAFEAHRLGATQIRLQDALDRLGGWSLRIARELGHGSYGQAWCAQVHAGAQERARLRKPGSPGPCSWKP